MALPKVLILIGSNLGDKVKNIRRAVEMIMTEANVLKGSSIYETEPWGKVSENFYLNQALIIETSQSPLYLLNFFKEIEKIIGREKVEKWGDRVIDIDIIFFDQEQINLPNLTIPHKELPNRKFVLIPCNEIASEWKHPQLDKTLRELLLECKDVGSVKKLGS